MNLIPCDETYHIGSNSYFQEWFRIKVGKRLGEGRGSYGGPAMINVIEKGRDRVFFKLELRPGEDLFIFGKDAGIKGKG